jgi:DNA-binding transcriptional LysR family regulator
MPIERLPKHWESRIGRRLRLRDLHILFAVVQWGSMAKAASHLGMSQPAVSEAMANLEDALRVRLLDRSSRGVEPTIYATALMKRGNAVFDELRQGIRDIDFLANPTAGEVRVASGETLAAGLLPAAIDSLSRQYPQIIIDLVQAGTGSREFQELRERRVDFVLGRVTPTFVADDLAIEILHDEPHVVVAGASSPWARRRKVSLAELVHEPWILPPNDMIKALISEAFRARGLPPPSVRVTAGPILLRNHLLATGRFLTALPASVLRYNAARWALKALPIELGIKPRPIAIVTLKNRTVSPVTELFIQHVRTAAKTMFAQSDSPRRSRQH